MVRVAGASLLDVARRAQGGDRAARDELLRVLYEVVRKHLFYVLGGGGLTEDAVQETMIALYRGLGGFRGDANPRTWALTIATRTAMRVRRKEARYVATGEVDAEVFDVDTAAAAEMVMLQRALATLTDKKREAFVLMSIFELTADEAGHVLSTFANTAASRNRHACAELERYLEEKL
ncbi:MAG TPA: RNA polymerase sigma factor [Kofleriaceae bacterium]|nr:RNA polymerase sigma factor [Kofleriaceae bacterium]